MLLVKGLQLQMTQCNYRNTRVALASSLKIPFHFSQPVGMEGNFTKTNLCLSYCGSQCLSLFIHDSHRGNNCDLIPIKVRVEI